MIGIHAGHTFQVLHSLVNVELETYFLNFSESESIGILYELYVDNYGHSFSTVIYKEAASYVVDNFKE